jgi:polysaccharide biosynthesis protein PelF
VTADICLLVEGTYPYVAGGVSSWLHALLSNLPEFTFTIVHLGSWPEPGREPRYRMPPNVVGLQELFLHDQGWPQRPAAARRSSPVWHGLEEFHQALAAGQPGDAAGLVQRLNAHHPDGLRVSDLVYAPESWDLLVARYRDRAPDSSLIDFFWTFRATHLPLFSLLQAPLPRARLYHTVSVGYAGLLAGLAKIRTGAPLLLTEHGIYTHEREIELAQSEWIYKPQQAGHRLDQRLGYYQQWWLNMFRFMARFTYDYADRIISITAVNQRYQVHGGADPGKMMVIPNGIDVNRLAHLRQSAPVATDRFVVGFIGRVVPIKDIKTFLRAIKIAGSVIPDLLVYIVGPTNEEPAYFAECRRLAELLELSAIVQFTGAADVREYYRQIDVVVLTSLSEGQPLVILEANCAGIPVVATEVGACRELLTGVTPEDQALGPSGLLTPAASPQETAHALIQLWRDQERRQRMGRAGQERVRRFYHQDTLYAAYRGLYQQYLAASPIREEQ